jgi:hypothetical protein
MAYDVQLAQLNTGAFGLQQANTYFGFPGDGTSAGVNFHTLLMSFWACGPLGLNPANYAAVWPEFDAARFFTFDPGYVNGIMFTNISLSPSNHFYHGTWVLPSPGMRMHFLMSVDTHAQRVQVYINDQRIAVADVWIGTPPFDFNLGPTANAWDWNVSGVATSGRYPALGDMWLTNPPAFVDLSVTANRRKFINADLTPVDLGDTGNATFGTSPNIYNSIRVGGVATDILINRGSGGGTWRATSNPPTLQAPGSCALPIPPPAGPAPSKLGLLRQPLLYFAGLTP